MGIDLELPSDEQDKLGTGSITNADIQCGTDGMNSQEDNLNSPTTASECSKEESGRNVNENVIGGGDHANVGTIAADVSKGIMNFEPQNGLEFESKEAAYSFYREYARSVGFGITIKASRRSKRSGKFIDVKIACSRFGNKRECSTSSNSRSCPKTDCKASMHMKRMQDGRWIINSFVKEHNHEICPDDFFNALRGRNKQSVVVSCQKKGLQLALDEGDVQLMLEHFKHMQDESPNFFYAIDLDSEKRLKNVFWVDAKGRHDYSNFCDVVFFDTYYVRNKYKIPFAPIVGVNHHFQFILLGCALIGDETLSSLVWLLRTWVKAVGGRAPRVIITDDDKSLKEAVMQLFPDARHCFCLWDVLGKIPKNLGHILNEYENFFAKFKKCIYRSWTDEQFEKRWWKLVDKFELQENEFIKSLFEDRKKWVPNYMKDTFLAGISTSERAESISFFDQYLYMETTFKEFLEQYKAYLQERYEMEAKADFETRHGQSTLRSFLSFEKQMAAVYTYEVFNIFQVEVLGTVNCHLRKESEDNATAIFQVDDIEQRQNFSVSWNEAELGICCQCRSFEYKGILCRHALLVLQISGVSTIPSRYVLKRWTKDAKIRETVSEIPKGFHCRLQRFDELCKRAVRLGEEGSVSRETYDIAFQALEEALKHCASMNYSVKSGLEPITMAIHGFIGLEENHGNNVSKASKKKKTHKKRKVRLEPEAITLGMQDSCQQMEQLNSRGHHTLDNCYVPQQDMQQMEGGSRPAFDGYYGAQQSMQGVVQFNLISPLHGGYYSNQQGMQGLGHLNSMVTRVGHYGSQQSMQGLLQGQLGFRAPAIHGCFEIQDRLQDTEQPMGSTQFHSIGLKNMNDKSVSQ